MVWLQGSIEEKIYQRQVSKQGLSGAVMDVCDRNDVQFSIDDLRVKLPFYFFPMS